MKTGTQPRGSRYRFELIECEDGSFQLCILLDALSAEEAEIEADEIVAIWNANSVGIS